MDVTLIIAVVLILAGLIAVAIALSDRKAQPKAHEVPFELKAEHHTEMGNGKCTHNRTRRASRRPNVNARPK